ncbi:hypothetical protein K437DRAFT_270606 [Tilletiaria anomala UBC 951]|uniref:Uncharacterized protein n=1 Tax=Tilletiaria anomala (strain ATCC 24038 / CBS 436.72 / UBC 951) TaxID=1037660 RepID=A0A066VA69_TILAU|nr:uncharacterized protein K437DRAFT_270606 [Tilletiaria anomala UBC 951]KDN38331.1 hypothetical protein K437DRAFT_270606 [Tilletiaria anomala UBC 951]
MARCMHTSTARSERRRCSHPAGRPVRSGPSWELRSQEGSETKGDKDNAEDNTTSFIARRADVLLHDGASLADAFGGLLPSGRSNIDISTLAGLCWLFLVEGLLTVVFGHVARQQAPRDVQSARFLCQDEKEGPSPPSSRAIVRRQHRCRRRDMRAGEKGIGQQRQEAYETILRRIYPGIMQTRIQLVILPVFVPATAMVLALSWGSRTSGNWAGRWSWCSCRLRWRLIHKGLLKAEAALTQDMYAYLPVRYVFLAASHNARVNYTRMFLITLGICPSTPYTIALVYNNAARHT